MSDMDNTEHHERFWKAREGLKGREGLDLESEWVGKLNIL